MDCSKRRISCETCGQSFKKTAYLRKHQQLKHSQECSSACMSSGKEDQSGPETSVCKKRETVEIDNVSVMNEQKGDFLDSDSDWDIEPDVFVQSDQESVVCEDKDSETAAEMSVRNERTRDKDSDSGIRREENTGVMKQSDKGAAEVGDDELLKGRIIRKRTLPTVPVKRMRKRKRRSQGWQVSR